MIFAKFFFIFLVLNSCSKNAETNKELPAYSDMGAAADAGRVVAPPVPEGL